MWMYHMKFEITKSMENWIYLGYSEVTERKGQIVINEKRSIVAYDLD